MEVLAARRSNHKLILLELNESKQGLRKRTKIFIFEAKWAMEEEGDMVVK